MRGVAEAVASFCGGAARHVRRTNTTRRPMKIKIHIRSEERRVGKECPV